jgi:glutamate--cysteine ligase
MYQYFSPTGLKKNENVTNSSRLILLEAEKHGIEWKIIPGTQVITLTYKGVEKSYYHQIPSSTTAVAKYICNNKSYTSNILHQAGIKVPKGYRITKKSTQQEIKEVFDSLQKPVVIKPSNGTWGENITLNITTLEECHQALKAALNHTNASGSTAIMEESFSGEEYRILATRDKVVGILKRIPANVIGNGKDTIKQLIKIKNQEPIRGKKGGTKSHLKIRISKKLRNYLSDQNLSLESVPTKNETVFLRRVSNVSQGGDTIDFTDEAHPSVIEIALKAIRSVPGLSFTGIDFMTKDITKQQTNDSYVIIEINDSPGFDIHDYPYKGKNRHAAQEFLYLMFPELRYSTAIQSNSTDFACGFCK